MKTKTTTNSAKRGLSSLMVAGALAALVFGGGAQAADAFKVVDVSGKAMPWRWEDGGLNTDYQFGILDGSAPAFLDFSELGIALGNSFGVLFVPGGLTNAFGGTPEVDNGGYRGSNFKNAELGTTGTRFPSFYLPDEFGTGPNEGVFLNSLVGAFTDGKGNIISPFTLGRVGSNGTSTLIGFSGSLGPGITRVQFGLNDDVFDDNTGSLQVCVDRGDDSCFRKFYGGGPTAVPEPGTWALMILGFGSAGAVLRRRRQNLTTAGA